jgi:predicted membrane-bound spermidine synthase
MRELLFELKICRDYILLGLVILMGIFTKIYNATQKGKKATLSFILAEGIVSIFVAISVYVITSEFLNLSKFLTFVLCAWGGSLSTLIHSEVEELISSFFDGLKRLIKTKIK